MSELGRPTLYQDSYPKKAFKLCLLGATDKDLADFFEVVESTINKWKIDYPDFSESIKKGKIEADANVANRLYKRALGFVTTEIVTANFQGAITDTKEVQKIYPPDTTAAIFWLKNRQPEKWREKQEIQHSGDIQINITNEESQLGE